MDLQKILDEQRKLAEESGLRKSDAAINKAIANRARFEDPAEREKIAAAYSSPEMKAVQASKSKPHTSEAIEKIRAANLGKVRKGQEWVAKVAEKNKGNTHHCKFCKTPNGVFKSKKEAIIFTEKLGASNASGKFDFYIKTNQVEKFSYISEEEYLRLMSTEFSTDIEWCRTAPREKKVVVRGVKGESRRRPVVINGVSYISMVEAEKSTGKSRQTLMRWISRDVDKVLHYYVDEKS